MSIAVFRDQKSFMGYFGQKAGPETVALYVTLIEEEMKEYHEALAAWEADPSPENLAEVADACMDMIYVIAGLMHGFGLDAQSLWDEVHRSNIAKIKHPCASCGTTGVDPSEVSGEVSNPQCKACEGNGFIYEVRRREDGKVLKPANWQPPALLPLVKAMLG